MRIRVVVDLENGHAPGYADMQAPNEKADALPFDLFARMYVEPAFKEALAQAKDAESSPDEGRAWA